MRVGARWHAIVDEKALLYVPMGFAIAEQCVSGDVIGMRTPVVSCSSNEGFQSWVKVASMMPPDPILAAALATFTAHHKSEAELCVTVVLAAPACLRILCVFICVRFWACPVRLRMRAFSGVHWGGCLGSVVVLGFVFVVFAFAFVCCCVRSDLRASRSPDLASLKSWKLPVQVAEGAPIRDEADETGKALGAVSPAKSINIDGVLVDLALWKRLGQPTNKSELNLAKRKCGMKMEKGEEGEEDEHRPQSARSSCFRAAPNTIGGNGGIGEHFCPRGV